MKLKAKFILFLVFVVQFLDCNTSIDRRDPYDENAKVYTQDGHIIFEAAHNKDISFKSNFGQVKLNGVPIQDLLKLVSKSEPYQLAMNQQPQIGKLTLQVSDLKDKLKNFDKLQDDVKELKETVKQMLNDNKIKPESVSRAATGYKKMKKVFDKVNDLLKTNECDQNPCKNSATCLDLFGDYMCQCADGWSGKNCDQDIDECKLYAGTTLGCQNNAQCINTQGSYHCVCKNGFQGTHCTSLATANNNPCGQATNRELCGHGQCLPITNSASNFTYSCICEPGWKKEASSPACTEDIDECALHREFSNLFLKGKKINELVDLPKQICSVKPFVECFNTLGSFRCGPCPTGYSGNGQFCLDKNECEVNNGGCSTNPFVQCINTEGSSVCGHCPENYSGDGVNCRQTDFTVNTGPIYSSTVHIYDEPCPTNPCLNEAPCYLRNSTDRPKDSKTMNKNDFYCVCDVGFAGKYCETIVNYCIQENGTNKTLDLHGPCKNNGTCYSLIGGYSCSCQAGWQGENCDEPQDACGGDLVAENGTIKFPTGDFQLLPGKNGYQCEWRIDAVIGRVIQIKLKSLNLKPTITGGCAGESLKISDGIPGYTQNRQLLKVCGNLKDLANRTVTSAHNFVTVYYQRDYVVAEEDLEEAFGFELDWKTVDPTCGGLINATSHGTINSPGYPTAYPQLSDCIWILKANFNRRIQLYFAELSIEEDGNCVNDYVQLFDGETEQDPSLGKFCKTTVPPPITSSGPFVRIQFVTDAFSTDKGFHLTYNTVPSVENCGGLFTNEKDHIVSPGKFGVKYPDNLECFYQIRLKDPNEKIKLTIKFLDLEEHKTCKFDFLEFFDGQDEYAPKLGRYCLSKSTNTTIISKSNVMLIKFRTDKSFRGNGFILSYEKWCGHSFSGTSGIVKSVGYPKLPRGEILCTYEINVPEKNLIKLEFQDFDLELSPNCTGDSLNIMETQNVISASYCGDTNPDTYVSSFNSLILALKVNKGAKHRGFKLSYSTVEVDCGGIFKTSPGFFSSPMVANGQNYKPNAKCNWVIRAPAGMIIKLTFNTFAIEKNGNCKFDYVRVLDSQFNEIGKYCGTEHPPLIQSTDNELIVEFASDKTKQLEGFSASFVFANPATTCGGHFAQESAEIISPGFYTQKRYEPNLNCVWHIVAPMNRQIRINFTHLDVESNDCTFDKIFIHNGPETGSPLLATICGKNKPPLLVSHSNELTIVFITDSNKEAKGFRLTYDTALTGNCGGTLSTPTGQVSSPHYPKPYHANAVCDYLIFVAKGSTVQLNFIEIDIERDSLCQYDFVELFDGTSEFSPKIGRYCNQNQNPGIIKSTSNSILVRFRSDASYGGRGFLLNYVTNCTNKLTGYRGVIESFNFPYTWFAPFECKYEISVPKGNKINIVITNLELEEQENEDCSKLSLTINQLSGTGEVKKNLTRKFCDTRRHPKIDENLLNFNSTTNTIQILFKKSELQELSEHSKSLMRLEYYLVGCGGEFLYKQRGLIQTPNYPKKHSFELDCIWHIQTSPGNRIVLNIIDFDLPTGKCIYGYVKVLGGPTTESPELAKICETMSSATKLTSSGSAMTIELKNGLGISGKGLNAQFYVEYHKGCGGTYTLPEATITSRNYPSPYDSSDDCFYAIESTELKQIEIKVVDLKLPALRDCAGGFLKIYDGRTSKSPVLSKHCGENFEPYTVRSNASRVLIEFRGSGHATSGGFKLTYRMICGGSVVIKNQGSQVLTNPNYPFLPPDRECIWHYTCDYDQKMAVTVTHLETTTYLQSKIQFYAGPSTSSPVIKTVQRSIPGVFVVPGNAFTISSNRTVFRLMISTLTNQCGGTIKVSSEGELTSPGWPENYPMGITCDWTLTTGHSNRIQLQFLDFKLQKTDFCNVDYLEIRPQNRHGQLIGRFCGNELPTIDNEFLHSASASNETNGAFEMGYNKLWIRFRSEKLGSDAGFRIKYSLLNQVILANDTGMISNSQYPSMTISDESIVWRITTSEATVISVTIKRIQLTMLRDVFCLSKLTFVDGDLVSGTVISQACGNEPPDEPIVSSSNQMTISYIGSGRSLFLLEYQAINQLAYEANKTLENRNMTNSNCTEEIYLNDALNNVPIMSPGFPYGYDNNLLCTWLVRSPIGEKIAIKVDQLNIEAGSCNYDKLNFFDKNLNEEIYLNQTLCGRKNDVNLMSNSNFAKIQFESDSVGNGTGFKATLSTACGGYVMGEQKGVLSYNAGAGEKSFKCHWVISIKRKKMSLKITSLLFSSHKHEDCSEDFLLIRDGSSINSPILGKYCNRTSEILSINETSSNQVHVTFYVFKPLYQSFSLSYEEVRVGCTQKYRLNSKEDVVTIQSPNWPNPPIGIVECDWTFLSPPSTSIRIDFKILNTNVPCNLSEQAISIFNGGSALSGLLLRDCPRVSSVFSTENMMHVNYITNGENLHAAFQASVQISVCGGTYIIKSSRVSLKSKNYGLSQYPNNLNCRYYFKAELPSYSIEFRISRLDLANNTELPLPSNYSDCDFVGDFIEIHDTDQDGPLLGKFCGTNANRTITLRSISDQAFLLFKTNADLSAAGFIIEMTMQKHRCGEDITGAEKGVIKSHNYDSAISSSLMKSVQRRCIWNIVAPTSNRVEVTFKKVNLKSDQTNRRACIDQLTFYSQPLRMSHNLKELNVKSKCNFVPGQKIVSLHNLMTIEFNTFGLNENEGFIIEYDTTKEALCGGLLSDTNGIIEMSNEYLLSRNVSVQLKDSLSCMWYTGTAFAHRTNYTFALTVDQLDFPNPEDSGLTSVFANMKEGDNIGQVMKQVSLSPKNPCGNSSVQIGQVLSGQMASRSYHYGSHIELCGNLTGRNLFYAYPLLSAPFQPVIFAHMVVEQQPKLMKIRYKFNKCGGTFYGLGTYASPNFGESNYENDLTCVYVVNVFFAGRLVLEFTDFDLKESPDCKKEYVEVLNGELRGMSAALSLGRFCGKEKPKKFIISGQAITVVFRTHSAITSKGFRFNVTRFESNQTCGNDIKLANKAILNWPLGGAYKNNANCRWTFEVASNYHMNIEFTGRFDLEQTVNCTNDYLLIEEKEAANKWRTLNRLCGIKRPESIRTRSNVIQVSFVSNQNVTGDGFQFVVSRECGRVFDDESPKDGFLSSPGYPFYDSDLDCEFVFNRTKNEFISLKLEEFNITDCPSDYLMIIRDKYTDSSPATTPASVLEVPFPGSQMNSLVYAKKLGPFCGENKPPELITNREYLKIKFKTDAYKASTGFKFSFKIVECGRDFIDEDSGKISSPNIDQAENEYIHNADCFFNIKVQENYSIVLRFEKLNIEVCGRQCHCDYVEILEIDKTATPLAKLCGHNKFPMIKSVSNQVRIHFHSDYTGSAAGFQLVFEKVLGERLGCGKTIFANTSGYVDSPDINQDGLYEKNLDCIWTITVPDQSIVKLTFESFDLEEMNDYTGQCRDYLQVNDGSSSVEPLIDVFCGKRKPDQVQSSSNRLFIYFKTDDLNEAKGFRIRYEAIQSGCGGQITIQNEQEFANATNYIQSPNWPLSYPNNIRCKWLFNVAFWLRVELNIVDFKMNCSNNDYLQISMDRKHEDLIKLCTESDYLNNRRLLAMSGLWLVFSSGQGTYQKDILFHGLLLDENHINRTSKPADTTTPFRFKIGYKILNCNQSYTTENGLIVSGKYPSFWTSNSNEICLFTIETDVGRTISVYFNEFSIGKQHLSNTNCDENRMEVKDGKEGNSRKIAVLCGFKIPNPIFSSGNVLSFYVKARNTYNKYNMYYTTTAVGVGCGGNLTSFNGTFTSPLYPNYYYAKGDQKECHWAVHSLGQNKLEIRFETFEFNNTNRERCNVTFLDIYDGETMNNETHLINLCPQDQPTSNGASNMYTSFTSFLHFKLVLGDPNEGVKFKIQYNIHAIKGFSSHIFTAQNKENYLPNDGFNLVGN